MANEPSDRPDSTMLLVSAVQKRAMEAPTSVPAFAMKLGADFTNAAEGAFYSKRHEYITCIGGRYGLR